jgi:hypothetical protein
VAFQSLLGIAGTGLAILVFVVLGNPSGGGAYATELLPGLWRTLGPLLPPGASTTAIREAAFFPEASLAGPLLVLAAWAAIAAALALLVGGRGRGMSRDETAASAVAVA